MHDFTRTQIRLQNELADLLNCYGILRDLYMQNQSAELLTASEDIVGRMQTVEKELELTIAAMSLDSKLPVYSLVSKKKFKI